MSEHRDDEKHPDHLSVSRSVPSFLSFIVVGTGSRTKEMSEYAHGEAPHPQEPIHWSL